MRHEEVEKVSCVHRGPAGIECKVRTDTSGLLGRFTYDEEVYVDDVDVEGGDKAEAMEEKLNTVGKLKSSPSVVEVHNDGEGNKYMNIEL